MDVENRAKTQFFFQPVWLAKPFWPLGEFELRSRNTIIESTTFDGSNHKNLVVGGDFANVMKQTPKNHHKMLANQVDKKHAFNSACVVRSPVTDGTFIDKDAALGDFCDYDPRKSETNDLLRPRKTRVTSFDSAGF